MTKCALIEADADEAGVFLPTREQIDAECELIRGGWSAVTELSRRVVKGQPYEIQQVRGPRG